MNTSELRVQHIAEIKALVEAGDVDLDATKRAFLAKYKCNTTLTNDQLIEVHASQQDDYGMDDIVKRMFAMENGFTLNWVDEQEIPAAKF